MKENGKQTARIFLASLGVLLAVVVALIMLFMFRTRQRITDQNQHYLEDAAYQSVKDIDRLFETSAKSIRMVSYLYQLQLDEPEFDYHMLNSMSELTNFDYLRFVGLDGVSWSGEGVQVDCRDREYYAEGIQGRTGVCYIPSSRFTNGAIVIFYAPLYYQREIIGVVNGVLTGETLSKQIRTSIFGENADTCLITRSGEIVAAAWGSDREPDSADFLSGLAGHQEREQVEQAMAEGRRLSFLYTGKEGTGAACLSPLDRSDFMVVQTFPPAATRMITSRANQDALWLEIALIALFLLYIAMAAAYYLRTSRTLRREKEDLGRIVDSVKRLYRRFVVFDLDANSYEYLEEGDISALGIPPAGTYSDWFDAILAKHEAAPEFWGNMEDMKADHLRETLTEEHWFSHREYQVPGDRWERLSLIRLDAGEHTSRILGAVEDVTEVKRRDEESRLALEEAFRSSEAASHAKSDFLARMSHDIRTPMNAIIGLTAIMGAHLDERERAQDCLGKITTSSKHLLGLINEVLDMSKIESGKLELSSAEFSLPGLVDCVLNIAQPAVKAKGQELTVHIIGLEHENVIGDDVRLQQVCVNILSNAVKYTNEGGHITLNLRELPGKQPQLGEYEFLFEDDGIGMSEEFMQRLFTPFERANDDQVRNVQGTGLGMAITQSTVHLMGGTILAESELGRGSRFTVRVPLKFQERDEAAEERLVGLPVLVADDDQVACESTCLLLDELGMQGEWVLTGREAVERTVEHHGRGEDFFAVILDWRMPGMDGVETARTIRREVGPDVPIIILSAYDWSDIESEARAAGVDMFIGKPLFKSRLRRAFVDLISGSVSETSDALDEIARRDYAGRRVLLVEDNELNQEIAREILEISGLTVDVAENGRAAVERFSSSPDRYYDMVFMDIQMPVMNGYDATRVIRTLPRPDAGQVPIVAMSANTFSEDVLMAQAAGMDQHIGKPLDLSQLNAVLERWLG